MSTQQLPKVGSVPDEIESPAAKLVYLYLTMTGEATLSDLQRCLDLKRLTLYTILKTLRERGLVQEDGDAYTPA